MTSLGFQIHALPNPFAILLKKRDVIKKKKKKAGIILYLFIKGLECNSTRQINVYCAIIEFYYNISIGKIRINHRIFLNVNIYQ